MTEFRVLGPVEVAAGGQVVAISSAKARAVLALLLVRANTAVPVDALADELWEGSPPGQAIAALRVHVSHLRKTLQRLDGPEQLMTRPAGYLLHVPSGQVDAQRFARLAERGRAELAAQRPTHAFATLREAEALWRGEAFADVAAMPSVDAERARLHQQRLAATEARFEAGLACGRHLEVVAELEHLTTTHPLRERLWEQLIVGLYRCGRQADALAAYETIRALLDNDLGLSPGPALTRLQTSVLRQEPELEWRPATLDVSRTHAPQPPPRAAVPGRLHALATVPLVGREAERRRLRRLWSAACQGRAQLVLVEGAAGSGKTHLCADLAAHAAGHGGTVRYGGCDQRALTPLQPFVEAFGRHPTAPAELLDDTDDTSKDGRLLLLEAISALLRPGSARQPLLLVLDDLHWADTWSLRLVGHLARRRSDLGAVMVVLGCRPPEVEDGPLVSLLADLAREAVTDRLAVGGLDRRAVRQLCRLAGLPTGDALPAVVHAATDGNAFYVQEVLRHLHQHGLPIQRPLSVPVPRSIAEVVAGRLAALAPPSRRLLQTAAVAGTQFRLETLAVAAELDTRALLDNLDDLIRLGWLTPAADDSDRYCFEPALLRAAVYGQLSPARRNQLELRLAEADRGSRRSPHLATFN